MKLELLAESPASRHLFGLPCMPAPAACAPAGQDMSRMQAMLSWCTMAADVCCWKEEECVDAWADAHMHVTTDVARSAMSTRMRNLLSTVHADTSPPDFTATAAACAFQW